MKTYATEHEGQEKFFESLRINDADFGGRTDGVYRGCLFENKLDFKNVTPDDALMQAVVYASRIRVRGEKLPEYLIVNLLNHETAYIYRSEVLLPLIEQQYVGAASKHRAEGSLAAESNGRIVDYSTPDGVQELLGIINGSKHTPYHIDASNVYGLALKFYKTNQDKSAFLDGADAEIRKPEHLDYIIPYENADNTEFAAIMDCLNPMKLQREQGAFYTPVPYVKEMQKMLLQAVSEVPEGMNYIIVDRCAGVGNLEEGLPQEILEHCVLSTIEPNEYQILKYRFAECVVVPDTDALAYDIIPTKRRKIGGGSRLGTCEGLYSRVCA